LFFPCENRFFFFYFRAFERVKKKEEGCLEELEFVEACLGEVPELDLSKLLEDLKGKVDGK
jgi:hypothetical protein